MSDEDRVQTEKAAIRAAILVGAAEADAGKFTSLTVDEIIEIGIARTRLKRPKPSPPSPDRAE